MKIKPLTLLNIILATVLLTSIVFSVMTENTSSSVQYPYDPWVDHDHDGDIDIYDVVYLCARYGSKGTPINTTGLLLELQERVEALQDEVNTLKTNVVCLNASLVQLEARISELEMKNLTQFIGRPAYDSGWQNISQDGWKIFTHNLSTTELLVYVIGKYSDYECPYIHQIDYGGEKSGLNYWGVWWQDLTETTVTVHRRSHDEHWIWVRVMIWKIEDLLVQDLPSQK